MATIKAPFNFVPVSDKVFFPDWADKISHDIPFEDGESGVIELKITAESPIFVRNGHTKQDAENKNDDYKSFSKVDNKYFIPATTIKGAVRNVLEIISYSKMSNIANTRYSLRDLQLKEDYLGFFQNSDVHCGWMRKDGETVRIEDHGIPKRISHKDLDSLWQTNFSNVFKNEVLLKIDDNRTALYKITLSEGKCKEVQYDDFPMNSVNPVDKRIVAKINPTGQHRGTIVLTGQPSARKDKEFLSNGTVKYKGTGKCYEFVFPNKPLGLVKEMNIYEDKLYKDFCFIYKDSEDWKYWRKRMERGEAVPVFFSLTNNELIHFGLSYLYKLPYKKRTKDCLPDSHKETKLDFSECIFGSTTKDNSLKGRVQFSHAFIESGEIEVEQKAYMGSPKSSYYPIYLQQEGENGYMKKGFVTMMSDKARLKGWKRYPIRDSLMNFTIPDGQEENANPFIPMNKGSVFKCKIRFHNLKKVEIGALLKAIHFNNKGFHSVGFAKAYGYGKVKIESNLINCQFAREDYISAFVSLIPDYTKSQELRELVLMSEAQKLTTPLEYMELLGFVDCKRQNFNKDKTGKYLQYYSGLIKKEIVQIPKVEAIAEVTLVQKTLILAKLIGENIKQVDSGDKTIKIDGNKRPKKGDKIIVEIVRKGGNIDYLRFKSIV